MRLLRVDAEREANLRNWESRVPVHASSPTYDLAGFAGDPNQLSHVVAYDAPFLGDLTGLDVVHLQCHMGKDTLSLARLGARVTGVDFSPSALDAARTLAAAAGIDDARFVESELYATGDVLGGDFDVVYTGVGALCWLPDIAQWADVVAALLKPGGRLYVRDAHPMLMAIRHDERSDDQLVVQWPYFEGPAQRWDKPTTYVDDLPISETVMYDWNHGLGEIVTGVLDAGLTLTALREHAFCDWKALPSMIEADEGWVLPEARERLPLMFTLEARKG
jgi:SAM-dependent methyltransferase